MTLFWRGGSGPQRRDLATLPQDLIPPRPSGRYSDVAVTSQTALQNSAVWACVRLISDLVSTLPLDVFTSVGDIDVEVPAPRVLTNPAPGWDIHDWMHATEWDRQLLGNTISLITQVDGMGYPTQLEPCSARNASVRKRANDDGYKWVIDGKEYDPSEVWHERRYPVPGFVLGLSPIAYAAWTLSEATSMQHFAADWFQGGGTPRAHLKNTTKQLKGNEADSIRSRHLATVQNGGVFVTGNDWEYSPIQAESAGMEWLEGRKYSVSDICRFFGVPGDLIGEQQAGGGGRNITYANVTQRNLQFLIMNLGPVLIQREKNLSRLMPRTRFVKFNSDALLRLDPETREKVIRSQIETFRMTGTEARELYNRPPLTTAQVEEIGDFWPIPATTPEPVAPPAGDNNPPPAEEDPSGANSQHHEHVERGGRHRLTHYLDARRRESARSGL